MLKIAVFPGSFDPITNGHVNIINRGLKVFDKIIIGIGNNSQKKYLFPLEKREKWIKDIYKNNNAIEVKTYNGLTVNFCEEVGSSFIIRGLRTSADFEFEKAIAHMNAAVSSGIESVFILSDLKYAALSSSIVRDIIRNDGDVSQFVPSTVEI